MIQNNNKMLLVNVMLPNKFWTTKSSSNGLNTTYAVPPVTRKQAKAAAVRLRERGKGEGCCGGPSFLLRRRQRRVSGKAASAGPGKNS